MLTVEELRLDKEAVASAYSVLRTMQLIFNSEKNFSTRVKYSAKRLAKRVGLVSQVVSWLLRKLADAGLLSVEKRGRQLTFYLEKESLLATLFEKATSQHILLLALGLVELPPEHLRRLVSLLVNSQDN